MTRLLHTGDTHIGYQQYNVPERRQDFLEAFRAVVEAATSMDVDAVVHAGDLFHDRRPSLVDLQGTIRILRQLADADIPFYAIVGNHETKRDAQWLDLFADLGLATRLGTDPVIIDDVALYGLDYVSPAQRDDAPPPFDAPPPDTDHTTLVTHGLFEPFAHAEWDTEAFLEDASIAFDALLLGDNHQPDTAQVDDTWVTYCGSTERVSAAEREDRGFNVVRFDDSITVSRRGIQATRPFVYVDVALEADEGTDTVRERVRAHDCTDAVVVVTIEGAGEPVQPAAIEELASDRGALISRVIDRREFPEESDSIDVHFADPDEAVLDRLAAIEATDAMHLMDEVVRDDGIPDSGVREAIEREVREHLEDETLDELSTPPDDPEEASSGSAETDPAERPSDPEPEEPSSQQDGQVSIGDFS